MTIETDNYLMFEVTFSITDREDGFNDDIPKSLKPAVAARAYYG